MRILHIIQKKQNRGAEMFACQLSNHLVKLGHEVKIVALFNGKATLPYSGQIKNLAASSKYRIFDISAWKKISNIGKEFDPDIIQANSGDTLKYAVFSKIFFNWNKPIISRNASEVGRYLKSPIQKCLNSFLYRNVAYVISVSSASKKDILNHFPVLKDKISMVPVGLEVMSKIENFSFKPINQKHIVHIGGFSFEKNHFGLLRIFQMIFEENSNVHLHLIGDGPLRSDIEDAVEKLGLNQNITFYGFVNNPLSYIAAADVVVLPSIIEGLPGVILESMLYRTPVVAYNVGGISEILSTQSGSLIEKNDEAGFVRAVIEVLDKPDYKKVENARRMVSKGYMNDKITTDFVKIYENVLK